MPKGGRQPGAGRPKGTSNKPKITDYMSEEEIQELVELAVTQAREKPELMKFILEQYFGKARQNIGLDGGEEDKPIAILSNVLRDNSHQSNSGAQQENPSNTGGDSSVQNNINPPILDSLGSK